MKIPKQITIGKNKIYVVQPAGLKIGNHACRGGYSAEDNTIMIAKKNLAMGYKFTPSQRTNTFWHEVTHAILHDMGHKLNHDEKFVSAFADRLTQLVETAVL